MSFFVFWSLPFNWSHCDSIFCSMVQFIISRWASPIDLWFGYLEIYLALFLGLVLKLVQFAEEVLILEQGEVLKLTNLEAKSGRYLVYSLMNQKNHLQQNHLVFAKFCMRIFDFFYLTKTLLLNWNVKIILEIYS